jgi:two-component system nitrogen regulation sensor histidine kinase NtrY
MLKTDAVLAWPGAMLRGEWSRAARNRLTILLVALGPILAVLTVLALGRSSQELPAPQLLRAIFLIDLVYILVVAALVVWRVVTLVSARRAQSAGSRLHLRLAGVFALVALAPTILVAVFATLTVSFGIEGWFSAQIGSVVRNSLETAQSYELEHRRAIQNDILAMANDLNRAGVAGINDGQLGELLRAQARIREIPEAFVFDSSMDLRARGALIEDDDNNEIRALVYLTNYLDYYLYVSRRVDGEVLKLLDETQETVQLYERLESERGNLLLEFAVLYLGFALIVILASIWLGLWFAEQLAGPIGSLAGAAQRVGGGDFDVRVEEVRGDDEIAVLSRVFNRMTRQVKGQRDALVAAHEDTERRRRFIETVLAGVTAGVVRLDPDGRVELMNTAGAAMIDADPVAAIGRKLSDIAPVFAPLLAEASARQAGLAQDKLHAIVDGREMELLARIARTNTDGEAGGYVVTFDDLTDLVSAQRMAAWGDVARRIAHEIKNPLTPIQLSAERLKRKFSGKLGDDRESFEQYTDMIVRQAGDIRRMVDEFSHFARMPAPKLEEHDLAEIVRDAVLLQDTAQAEVRYIFNDDAPAMLYCDRGLVSQALTNLLKNAGEAVEARREDSPEPPGEVRVTLERNEDGYAIRVADNGVGLPETARGRLTEPYVTTRAKGTGLGLAIVKKVAEEHGGTLSLGDAAPFEEGARPGAEFVINLPLRRIGASDADPGATSSGKN